MPPRDPNATGLLRDHFTYRLNTLSKLNDMASQALYGGATGLSLAEVRTLAALGAAGALSVNELAMEVNLDKAQASRLARAMAEEGLLARSSADADRRVVRLTLTRRGRALWHKVMPLIEQRNAELLACLDAGERTALLAAFGRLLEHARAAHDGRSGAAAAAPLRPPPTRGARRPRTAGRR
jgi:DNA-binding MarR family transcriptional regulator